MSRTIDYPFEDGTTKKMTLRIAQYADNDNLYVGLYGPRGDDVIPLTVNIDKLGYPMSCVDTNNLGDRLVPWLEENGLARFTGQALPSGYCAFPIMAFNPEVLRQIDAKAFAEYQESHGFMPEQGLKDLADEEKERTPGKNANQNAHDTGPEQQGIDRVLMVIENYQGICEHNFLVTESWLYENNLVDSTRSPAEIKEILHSDWQADFYRRSDISYLVKSCESLNELQDFQNGMFNDHSQSQNKDWYWEFQKERCTPEALQIIQKAEIARSANEPDLQSAVQDTELDSIDELAKEAKERAAEKNAERSESHKTNERKGPEMGR